MGDSLIQLPPTLRRNFLYQLGWLVAPERRSFLWLWVSQIMSRLGDNVFYFALPWLIYDLTGRASAIALVSSLMSVPMVVLAFLGGALADAFNRRRLMISCDFVAAVATALILYLAWRGHPTLWSLAVVGIVLASAQTIFYPALRASIPHVVGHGDLPSANALMEASGNTVSVGGPLLAGAIVGVFGTIGGVALNVVSFVFSALVLASITIPQLRPSGRPVKNVFIDVHKGLLFVYDNTFLRLLVILTSGIVIATTAATSLGVFFSRKSLNLSPGEMGTAYFLATLGPIAGGILAARENKEKPSMFAVSLAFFLIALAIMALAASHHLLSFALSRATITGGATFLSVTVLTLLQRLVPNEMLGRAIGAVRSLTLLAVPVVTVVAGVLADSLGVRAVFLSAGLFALLLTAAAARHVRSDVGH